MIYVPTRASDWRMCGDNDHDQRWRSPIPSHCTSPWMGGCEPYRLTSPAPYVFASQDHLYGLPLRFACSLLRYATLEGLGMSEIWWPLGSLQAHVQPRQPLKKASSEDAKSEKNLPRAVPRICSLKRPPRDRLCGDRYCREAIDQSSIPALPGAETTIPRSRMFRKAAPTLF